MTNKLTNKKKKQIKKLYGVYKHCIDAVSFTTKTKTFRNELLNKMTKISKSTQVPINIKPTIMY